MHVEIEIVKRLYELKYKTILSFERYEELLKKGLDLINSNGLSRKCSPTEQNALEVGLDYITETMLQH